MELAELASRDEASLSFHKVGQLELPSADAALELAYNIPLATAAALGVVCIADSDGMLRSLVSVSVICASFRSADSSGLAAQRCTACRPQQLDQLDDLKSTDNHLCIHSSTLDHVAL